jgi:hypothetical protein
VRIIIIISASEFYVSIYDTEEKSDEYSTDIPTWYHRSWTETMADGIRIMDSFVKAKHEKWGNLLIHLKLFKSTENL